jgi:hypothetical protein
MLWLFDSTTQMQRNDANATRSGALSLDNPRVFIGTVLALYQGMNTKRARALRNKATGECFVVTASGKRVSYGVGITAANRAIAHARRLNSAAERDDVRRSLGLVKTPYGWE